MSDTRDPKDEQQIADPPVPDTPDQDAASGGNQQNTQGVADGDSEADTASGGAPEAPDTTDEKGIPVDNPSGG